jgi:RNA polymerase sigma factor (sigma-70 family)
MVSGTATISGITLPEVLRQMESNTFDWKHVERLAGKALRRSDRLRGTLAYMHMTIDEFVDDFMAELYCSLVKYRHVNVKLPTFIINTVAWRISYLLKRYNTSNKRPRETLEGSDYSDSRHPPDEAPTVEDEYAYLHKALKILTPEQRELIWKHLWEGRPLARMASDYGVGAGAVQNRYREAIGELKNYYRLNYDSQ